MCGICGIINFDGTPADEKDLRRMMAVMKHRGPDDEGIFLQDNLGLGFVRLSIIDLSSAGHQPMISANGRYVLIFNGEIFNYVELREELIQKGYFFQTKTDTEVLINSYIEWGEDCLHHFNGMWAFVIFDREKKKLFGARDRYGIKPFYYYDDDNRFVFASEITPLLSISGIKAKPNNLAIFDYLIFSRTDHNEETFFENILRLVHGWKFSIDVAANPRHDNPELKLEIWYDLRKNLKEPYTDNIDFQQSLSSAIGLRLRSDVPVGVCFSGGLDSSSIVSILLKVYDFQDLNTFSTTFEEGQYGDETEYINEYRSLLKYMYFTTPSAESLAQDLTGFIRAHGEPIPSTSPYAQFKVMELAKEHVVVTIDGQGADELLAGYHYFYAFYFKELLLKWKLFKLLREMIGCFKLHRSLYPFKTFAFLLLPNNLMTGFRLLEKGYLNEDFYKTYRKYSNVSENIYGSKGLKDSLIDHFNYKLEHLLKWEDRNSMWFSLEARIPFLDHRFVERTLSMSSEAKIKNGWTKYILRESMKGMLPEKIRMRKGKLGFGTPEDEWFRTDCFKQFVLELLDSKSFKDRGIIDVDKAKAIYMNHLNKKSNHSKEIWKWIHLELWFREFID
jgi:asparagine synthase (glutamine-hydrolysing)